MLMGNCVSQAGTDEHVAELLEEMRMPQSVVNRMQTDGFISTVISETKNDSGWKKRELVSAQSLGLAVDHCAAGCEDPEIDEIDTLFRQLPHQHDFSPGSWQRSRTWKC